MSSGDLPAQRGKLLVEKLDLGQRLRGNLLFLVERGAQPGDRRAGARALLAFAFEQQRKAGRFRLLGLEIIAQRREIELELGLGRFLERQQFGQLGDLRAQLAERAVLSGDLARQQELRHDEHREQEGDDQQQLRHRIDEARPVGRLILPAAPRARACAMVYSSSSTAARLAEPAGRGAAALGGAQDELLHLVLLHLLGLRPLAHDLLLLAHLLDEARHRVGELLHRFAVLAGSGKRCRWRRRADIRRQRLVERLVDALDALLQARHIEPEIVRHRELRRLRPPGYR